MLQFNYRIIGYYRIGIVGYIQENIFLPLGCTDELIMFHKLLTSVIKIVTEKQNSLCLNYVYHYIRCCTMQIINFSIEYIFHCIA